MSVMYKTRPADGSQKAWDYISRVYGKIDIMQFDPSCCGDHHWTAQVEGKIIVVDSKELMGERGKI